MESDDEIGEPKPRGRKPSSNNPRDLSGCWSVFSSLRPDLPATRSLQDLCDAMKPFWRGTTPNYTTVSSVLNHSRPASDIFLKALNGVSGLGAEGHSFRIWLLSSAEFEETIAGNPYETLRKLAVETLTAIELLSESEVDTPVMMAALGAPAKSPKKRIPLGEEIRLRLHIPFDSYVRVFSVDFAERPPVFYSLDPWLGLSGAPIAQGTRTLPEPPVDPIPVQGDASESAVIMIATRKPIETAWPDPQDGERAPRIAKEVVRKLAWALKGIPAEDRYVEVLRFEAYAPTSSEDRGKPAAIPLAS